MSTGADRYDVKRAAGWTPQRLDGSAYSRDTDRVAAEAERWVQATYGGTVDTRVLLSGDDGYDVILWQQGRPLKVDVIHAGVGRDGTPRPGPGSWMIVNPGHRKLVVADVLAYVAGPPFTLVGAVPTDWFRQASVLRDFGFGDKHALRAEQLWPLEAALDLALAVRYLDD